MGVRGPGPDHPKRARSTVESPGCPSPVSPTVAPYSPSARPHVLAIVVSLRRHGRSSVGATFDQQGPDNAGHLAEATCEAAQRPSMRFVPVKTEEQQANGIVFRARDLLVRQRTQCVNALRGHLMEYGYVFPKGITHVETLVAVVEDLQSSFPDSVRVILKLLVDTFT